jgi:hypothetical protein
MLLLAIAVILVALSSAALAAMPSVPRRLQGLVAELAVFLGVLGLLWTTALLAPPPISWLGSGAGVLGFTYARARLGGRARIAPLILGLALVTVTFHFMLALFDLAMSTRHFASDEALLRAAVRRGLSPSSLTPAAPLVLSIVGGGAFGLWLAVKARKRVGATTG